MDIGTLGIIAAFGAGVLSFLSPCVFPLIPAYLAQLTGTSFQDLQEMEDNDRRRIMVRNSPFRFYPEAISVNAWES